MNSSLPRRRVSGNVFFFSDWSHSSSMHLCVCVWASEWDSVVQVWMCCTMVLLFMTAIKIDCHLGKGYYTFKKLLSVTLGIYDLGRTITVTRFMTRYWLDGPALFLESSCMMTECSVTHQALSTLISDATKALIAQGSKHDLSNAVTFKYLIHVLNVKKKQSEDAARCSKTDTLDRSALAAL